MARSLVIFRGKSKKASDGADDKTNEVEDPSRCTSPGETHESYRSTTPSKSRYIGFWDIDARQEGDSGVYGGSSRQIDRTEAHSKSRRRFSNVLIRRLGGELAAARGSRRGSVDAAPSDARPIKRRSFVQWFFGVEEQPIAVRSPSHRASSPASNQSSMHPQTFSQDWDFICRGETPVVPTRDTSDELTLLEDDIGWAGNMSSFEVALSRISSPDPAYRPSSPSSPVRYRPAKASRISSKDISDPIPIPCLSRRRAYIPSDAFDVLNCSPHVLQPRVHVK